MCQIFETEELVRADVIVDRHLSGVFHLLVNIRDTSLSLFLAAPYLRLIFNAVSCKQKRRKVTHDLKALSLIEYLLFIQAVLVFNASKSKKYLKIVVNH